MYSIGLDIGSSSVKASLLDVDSGLCVTNATSPETEMKINCPEQSFAEQDPEEWWKHCVLALKKILSAQNINKEQVKCIGISYQMHGLVCLDKSGKTLRPAIIWCDGRAVEFGKNALAQLGTKYCTENLLNSPGNFTASKLAWVKLHEPHIYKQIHKIVLPGDYISYQLTGQINTSYSGLSEGIFWDFKKQRISTELLSHFGFDEACLPKAEACFSNFGSLLPSVAAELGLSVQTQVTYKAGDQVNNALSLNVLQPGEVAATAGTSGVLYRVTENVKSNSTTGINFFLHANNTPTLNRLGALMCVNGAGILNSWARREIAQPGVSYHTMNQEAAEVPIGSQGLSIMPFGNGAERILDNHDVGCSFHQLNFNVHSRSHIYRAIQEGIANAFCYGIQIMDEQFGLPVKKIKAGNTNLFQSPIFCEALANLTDTEIELYETDGALGAARAAAFGSGYFNSLQEALIGLKQIKTIQPQDEKAGQYKNQYTRWLNYLPNT